MRARYLAPTQLLGLGVLLALGACAGPTESVTVAVAPEQVDPRAERALLAVERALRDGEDEVARSVLNRVWAQQPSGATAAVARRLDDLLAGREATAATELALRTRLLPQADGSAVVEVSLEARSTDGVERTLEPGSLALSIETLTVDAACVETRPTETISLSAVPIACGASSQGVGLWKARWVLAPGAMASRLMLRLEIRAGRWLQAERILSAQAVPVTPGKAAMVAQSVTTLGAATGEELLELARSPDLTRASALRMAVRIPPEEHAAALRLLADASDVDVDPVLERLLPAVRWLCGPAEPPQTTDAVRRLLRQSKASEPTRGELRLPRSPRG